MATHLRLEVKLQIYQMCVSLRNFSRQHLFISLAARLTITCSALPIVNIFLESRQT
jgi:hypothetical protein